MTSLKSIMERRTMQVLDVRDMKNLKGGANVASTIDSVVETVKDTGTVTTGGGYPPEG